ncbi:MAG: tyrosine-type recombinase/integrase [Lachnospiraceae bacterium]|nr:tyrosine-type recombinase/integrase [Lachnospiraceae bacterium]
MKMTYHEEEKKELTIKLRKLLLTLPEFCYEYFRGIEPTTAERTRLGYAHDLMIFFEFMRETLPSLKEKTIQEIQISDLKSITTTQLEMFLDYLTYYDREGEEFQNGEKGKARKLAAVRSLFKYFYRKQLLPSNPASLISTPKIHDKTIIKLDVDEIARLLDQVESGDKLTKKQQAYHKATKTRDLAIVTLLLGTGIRVSECVGLDVQDVDFNHNGIKIIRKGGNEAIVYFGDEVREALIDYIAQRKDILPMAGHENALFLSMQKRRLTVRSVENLVKKYSQSVIALKHISPHKLRSSYGTALYNETGDIYLVADVLGHKDVNTTRKHYAQLEDARRRSAAKAVHLRRED